MRIIFLKDLCRRCTCSHVENMVRRVSKEKPKLPGYLYGDYLRDKANLDVFCAGVWQALGEVIGDDQLEKVLNWSKRIDGTYVDYVTHRLR